jgi:thioesterase domain-containing protein
MKLMRRMEQTCGKRLPIAALFQAPTIEQLSILVRQQQEIPEWSSLVLIQEGTNKPPFFCVHGEYGDILGFRDLARHMDHDLPIYALRARGLDGKQPCFNRVEDMAKHYIDQIGAVQPHGPYYLGGFSNGGVVAFEMARQLEADGEEVGLVALLDTYAPNYKDGSPLKSFWKLPARRQWFYVRRKLKYWLTSARKMVSARFLPRPLREVRRASAYAFNHYVPGPYAGRVVLFRASDGPLGNARDQYLGWDKLAMGGVDVCRVPGDHVSIIAEPQSSHLATRLTQCLEAEFARRGSEVLQHINVAS